MFLHLSSSLQLASPPTSVVRTPASAVSARAVALCCFAGKLPLSLRALPKCSCICPHSCICRLCPRSRSLLLCGEFHLLAAAKTGRIFCPALLSEEFRRRFLALLAREILPRSASSRSAAPEAADVCTQENGAPFRCAGQSTAFSADAACHGPQSDADAQHARNHCLSIEDASLIRGTVQQIACGSHAQRRGPLQRFAPAPRNIRRRFRARSATLRGRSAE